MSEMMHLLNCCACDFSKVVLGPSRNADFHRECHEDSIRNWARDTDYCPKGSVAWAFITDEKARRSLQGAGDDHA